MKISRETRDALITLTLALVPAMLVADEASDLGGKVAGVLKPIIWFIATPIVAVMNGFKAYSKFHEHDEKALGTLFMGTFWTALVAGVPYIVRLVVKGVSGQTASGW